MTRTRILTGITTSGTPHLGNYAGAIRPAIESGKAADVESFYFLADYHALIKAQDPALVQRSTLEIAAAWLACGLDPRRTWFYRQSDIPEIPELTWFLTCVAGKGLLNRAHAYKAANDRNAEEGLDADAGVTAGLFMYPVLMAADILIFDAQRVPVGRDQIQHIEMARDFGQRFNHTYGGEYFVLPEAQIDDSVATLPGLDGRKMSKSYRNTIPLFAPSAELRKLIAGIVTDTRMPGEPKDPEGNALFELYSAFATAEQSAAFAHALRGGLGWGDAKTQLFELLDQQIAPMRERYDALIADPAQIEAILLDNAQRLRETYAIPKLRELRSAIGIRPLTAVAAPATSTEAEREPAEVAPVVKQYRESDGSFRFKLTQGDTVLLQSVGFANPKEAGAWVARIRTGAVDVAELQAVVEPIADESALQAGLSALAAAWALAQAH